MGATNFITRSWGKNVEDAYQKAVEDADRVYGHQEGYSGEINSTTGCKDVTRQYEASHKSLDDFIEDNWEHQNKHLPCWAVCVKKPVENTNKVKSQVEHIVQPGTKKWILMYEVVTRNHLYSVGYYRSKGDAVVAARKYTEKTQIPTEVHMTKLLEGGNTLSARITYKPAPKEGPGEWVFFGLAPE